MEQSPAAREARARVAVTAADARSRTLHSNPRINYSREEAGFTSFYQAEQTLPVTGRLRQLRAAVAPAIAVTEADAAFQLWTMRAAVRQAFYRVLASQERESLFAAGIQEIDGVLRVLRKREEEGEGSKFDRLRTERERAELLAELSLIRADTILERSRLAAFLPAGTPVDRVAGTMSSVIQTTDGAQLFERALRARADYRAGQKRVELARAERLAAERLRYPEPTITGGLKRADIGTGLPPGRNVVNGVVFGVSIPIPSFNKGQYEVARFSAEEERAGAQIQLLAQEIRAAIDGNLRAWSLRKATHADYARELAGTGSDLIQIATVAYQEGEIGILQLLDTYRTHRQAQLRDLTMQALVKEAQIELESAVGEELDK